MSSKKSGRITLITSRAATQRGIVILAISTLRYRTRKIFDEVRRRLRELAGMHVRYGYRRLTVLLRREG